MRRFGRVPAIVTLISSTIVVTVGLCARDHAGASMNGLNGEHVEPAAAQTANRSVRYSGFSQLKNHEQEGKDFLIHLVERNNLVLIMAPHGGGIEPGASEIALAVSQPEYNHYSFEGLKRSGNRVLHITSSRFDEPVAMAAAKNSRVILTFHGCTGDTPLVFMGGLDSRFKHIIELNLQKAGFHTGERQDILGNDPANLCNRGSSGRGVQLELTQALRRLMFRDLTREGRKYPTEIFTRFVSAMKEAFSEESPEDSR